jgi:hypothetical protein
MSTVPPMTTDDRSYPGQRVMATAKTGHFPDKESLLRRESVADRRKHTQEEKEKKRSNELSKAVFIHSSHFTRECRDTKHEPSSQDKPRFPA